MTNLQSFRVSREPRVMTRDFPNGEVVEEEENQF